MYTYLVTVEIELNVNEMPRGRVGFQPNPPLYCATPPILSFSTPPDR